ncbi:MAG: hypothetical protein ACK5AY_11860 [Bacteroidota bacterium]|jgi:hypothetical protein
MKNKDSQNLVKGRFSKNEAKEIISNLFASKIRFHTISAFGLEERASKKAEEHNKRKKQLNTSMNELLDSMNDKSAKEFEFEISCNLKLKPVKKQSKKMGLKKK